LERNVCELRWGLLPRFRERTPVRRSTFNARIETLATSPLYGPLLPLQRCVVFADGYYEWPRRPDGSTDPIWIFRADGATIAFAGLWDADSVTIVTQPPNETIARLHDRMPVTLEPGDADAWLAPEPLDPQAALAILRPSDPEIWQHHRVERTVGNARAEGPDLIAPRGDRPRANAQLDLFADDA
jgi:putative SOS response-associated peptidase YedK